MAKVAHDRKYVQSIESQLPPGFRVGRLLGAHPCILDPDDKPLRLKSGMPVKLCSTPGDSRALRNDLAKIRRALRARKEGPNA